MDEAGITLLGYLPQDMINTSIFNYYHPQDLPLIFAAYQQCKFLLS
jgi:period circadian protein